MKKYLPNRIFPQEYTLVVPEETLRFNSKFESGNLKKAIKMSEREYNLQLDYDIETKGYTQWFYFSVTSSKSNQSIRFNITNLVKFESLYNAGMKPLVFSLAHPEKSWHRDCSAVSYYKNEISRNTKFSEKKFYTLSFTYYFKHPDTIFFSHSFPYTYSDLQNFLSDHKDSAYLRVDSLCNTLAGNSCPVLTITNNVSSYTSWDDELVKLQKSAAGRRFFRHREAKLNEKNKGKKIEEHIGKKCIFLTARVHPGESNGSFMMKGALEFLLGDSREANILRKKFIFKVVPMLNPDGVIYGNYRCSLLGVDLNRRWSQPNKLLHPEIYYCKRLIQMVAEERDVLMFCDMHGHSIKKDVFMYGCCSSDKPKENAFARLFPYLLARRNRIFSYKNCSFRMHKEKFGTGRVVCYNSIGILASYTMEASFYGPSHKAALENRTPQPNEPNDDSHMATTHLEGLGQDFCKQLLIYLNGKEFSKKIWEISHPQSITRVKKLEDLQANKDDFDEILEDYEEFDLSQMISEINTEGLENLYTSSSSDAGSDSSGSDNDEKKNQFKNAKKLRSAKTAIKPTKKTSFSNKKPDTEISVTSLRASSETPVGKLSSIVNKSQRYYPMCSVKKETQYRISKSPDSDIKQVHISRVLQAGGGFRNGLKFAAAVKLPKESDLFKHGIHGKIREMTENKGKKERSEMLRTKVKLREVMMNMDEEFKIRSTYQDFYK